MNTFDAYYDGDNFTRFTLLNAKGEDLSPHLQMTFMNDYWCWIFRHFVGGADFGVIRACTVWCRDHPACWWWRIPLHSLYGCEDAENAALVKSVRRRLP